MSDITAFIITCLGAVFFIMPAYIANLSGLAFGGTTPVDLGKKFIDGRRIIGNGVTWKGLFFGTVTGTLTGVIEGIIIGDAFSGLILGFLLSFGALVGDAVGSFIKRRVGIERGEPAPILDQLDFLAGALIFASLYVHISLTTIIIAAVLTIIIHLISNIVAYLVGIKDVWY